MSVTEFQPELYKDVWMQTYPSGKAFPVLCPGAGDIDIRDIANALSNLCRFAGHVKKFYSVAQHSVIVSHNVPPEYALEGLLHDAPEAYCVDLPRPIKHSGLLDNYKQIENRIWLAIAEKYSLKAELPTAVKEADARCLLTEQRDLKGKQTKPWEVKATPYVFTIRPLTPRQSRVAFMRRFRALMTERDKYGTERKAA